MLGILVDRQVLIAYLLLLSGCFDTPLMVHSGGKGGVASEASVTVVETKTDASGVVTANVDSKSKETQVLKLSDEKSGLAGATVTLPRGSLPASTQLVIQQGASLASSLQVSSAGTGKVEAVSVALVIKPTVKKDPILPLALSLPIGKTQLTLAESFDGLDNIAVAFKYIKYSDNESISLGIIPKSEMKIVDGNVYFSTPYFGSFQIIKTEFPVEIAQELKTKETILTKIEEIKAAQESKIDTTPPSAANSLYWTADIEDGPATLYDDDFVVTINWVQGVDAESAIESQTLRYYESSTCNGTAVEQSVDLKASSPINTGKDGVFTAQIITTNIRGLTSISGCSTPITIDSTAPTAVTTIAITDTSALNADISFDNDLDITVKWGAGSDSQSGLSSYFVEIFNGTTCTGTPSSNDFVSANSTFYNFSGADNSSYTFRITALNNSGLSSTAICSHSVYLSTSGVSRAVNLNIRPDSISDTPVSFDDDPNLYLTWNSASSPNGIVDYTVRLYNSNNCSGTAATTLTAITTTSTTVTVANDGIFSFEVEAFDTLALAATSNCSSPTTVDTSVPNAPQNLAFAQSAFDGAAISLSTANSFFLRFDQGSDAESNIANHDLEIYESSGCTGTQAANFPNLANPYVQFTSAYHNATYSFRVRARNGAGGVSSWVCSTSSIANLRVFSTPMSISVALGNSPSEELDLSWIINTTGQTGFKVFRSTQSGSGFAEVADLAANVATLTDTGLSANTTYYYKVLAYTSAEGVASNVVGLTTAISPPDAPANVFAAASSSNTFKITWDSSATATSYNLYFDTSPGVTVSATAISNISATSYTHAVTQHSVPFYYRVAAVNSSGEGELSTPEVSASTYGLVTTAQSIEAINSESGRKLFYDEVNNRHWVIFANDNMGTKTLNAAVDNSTNTWLLTATSIPVDNLAFDVTFKNIGGQPYVFVVYESLGNIKLSRGLLSANNITWDPPLTTTTTSPGPPATSYTNPAVAVADNDILFIAMTERVGALNAVKVNKSNQSANSGGLTFGMSTLTDMANNSTKDVKLDASSSGEMYLTINDAGAIYCFKYSAGTWDDISTATQGWANVHSANGLNAPADFVTMFRNKIVAAGAFTYAGGFANAHNIAQSDRKGWRPLGRGISAPPFGPVITAMHKTDQAIYIGGKFAIDNDNHVTGIAAWDGDTWHDLGGNFTQNSSPFVPSINAIVRIGQKIVVAGQFDGIDNSAIQAANIAIFDIDAGTWSAPVSGTDGPVYTLAAIANNLYVGGNFASPFNKIAKYDMTTGNWSNIYTTAPNGAVTSIVASNTDVFVAGQFTSLDGITAKVLKYNGSAWSQVANSTSLGQVVQLAVVGSNIFAGIGAGVSNIQSCALTGCASWTSAGNTGTAVKSIAEAGGGVIAASVGDAISGSGRIHSCSAGTCTDFLPSSVTAVRAIAELGSKLVLVGDLSTTANNIPNTRSLAFDTTAKSWAAGPSVTSGSITDIVPTTGVNAKLLGTFAKQVASYVASTNTVTLPTTGFAGAAELVGLWDGTNLNVGGTFNSGLTSIAAAKNIFRYNSNDTVTSFINGLNAVVLALEKDATLSNVVYAGGDFVDGSSVSMNKVAKWDGSSWSPLGSGLTTTVYDLELIGNDLCAAWFSGLDCFNGTSWDPLGGTFNASVYKLKTSGGYHYALGNYTTISGSSFKNIARYNISNLTWEPLAEGLRANASISYNDLEIFQGSVIASIGGGNIRHFRPMVASGVSRFDTAVLNGNLHIVYENQNGILQHRKFDTTNVTWSAENQISGAFSGSSFTLSKFEPSKLVVHTLVNDIPHRFYFQSESWTNMTPLFEEGIFYNFSCEPIMASDKLYCAWMNPTSYPIPIQTMYFAPSSF